MADSVRPPVVNQIPTMPYWPIYIMWADHYALNCGTCLAVMDHTTGGSGLAEDLCPAGKTLADMASQAVDDQAVLAALN